ncbi:MAG: hypothetical protein FWE21_00345 [Defluviitaleaceae bacterium]|nr:hypothetical protein [Defluviitaleaceae bacterium]
MLSVTRYINGKKVNKADLEKYILDSNVVLEAIQAVNVRLSPQDTLVKNAVENITTLCYDEANG